MSTREDYITAIGQLVQGEIPLDEGDKILAINIAMKAHSKRRPRVIVEDEDGDGGFDYAITDLEYWSDGFSVIQSVEYPVDDDDETPDILQDDAWMIYEKPSGKVLRFKEDTPTADEDFRVVYTALHTCTTSACCNFSRRAGPIRSSLICRIVVALCSIISKSSITDSMSSITCTLASDFLRIRLIFISISGTCCSMVLAASTTTCASGFSSRLMLA